jgi:hypothetical protein
MANGPHIYGSIYGCRILAPRVGGAVPLTIGPPEPVTIVRSGMEILLGTGIEGWGKGKGD